MVRLNASEHVHAAGLACIALDHRRRVDDLQFVAVRADAELFSGHDADDREQSPIGLPALRTAARVVECDVRVDCDFDGRGSAFAAQFAAGAVVCLLACDAAVDGGVECLR